MAEQEAKPLGGKKALISGGGKRLGRAMAVALARAGADTAITFFKSRDKAQETLKELQASRVHALALECDVRDAESVRAAVNAAASGLGGLDILINNAATYETVRFETLTISEWDQMFATNVRGPFLLSKEAVPHLRERRGRIIHLGSLGGVRPWANHAHYCSSKAALHMLTKVMAKALAPEIAVNCVAPGMIDLGEESVRPFMERMARQTPMRRNGTAGDVTAAVISFATMPHFVTGQVLIVDGGLGL
ncbi:MAG: SDR family oxidoreductase [Acidobacteria bacterium]|nr:SDR family oxidoreductase [Acidobacteriota bacterium]MBV9622828.1 SDR family oxidoreductase [Acidobacteriota bacterium]